MQFCNSREADFTSIVVPHRIQYGNCEVESVSTCASCVVGVVHFSARDNPYDNSRVRSKLLLSRGVADASTGDCVWPLYRGCCVVRAFYTLRRIAAGQAPKSDEREADFTTIIRGGWPTQARFRLEWGSSKAGPSRPAARSRFLAFHSDSISTRPSDPVAYCRKLLHSHSQSSAALHNRRFTGLR